VILQSSVDMHVFAIIVLFIIILVNFYLVLNEKEFISLSKKLKIMTPLFHLCNAIVFYTGAIVAAHLQKMNPSIILMIIMTILLMILEIKRYKKMRIIKSSEISLQTEFRFFTKKIYTSQIIAIILTILIAFILN